MNSDEHFLALIRSMSPLELLRIAPMDEAGRLSSLSPDTIERDHPNIVKKLSNRRKGVRVLDALMLRESDIA
jgi:hypothetical protein